MKQCFFVLLLAATFTTHAQVENTSGRLRAGAAYTHDFPGLTGFGATLEYNFPLNDVIQGSIGIRHIETAGYPRTSTVQEYTKANSIDFNLLFALFHTDNAAFRLGAGYSFSLYKVRRSYPVYAVHGVDAVPEVSWPQADAKGNARGISLSGEYEYYFRNGISAGAKVAVCKAYGTVVMGGPFIAFAFR
jgi:hypothetical protein